MKEIHFEYTFSPLGFIKTVKICTQKFIFRHFVIVGPFTILEVIMLTVDYL
jgi:hypothetical protein